MVLDKYQNYDCIESLLFQTDKFMYHDCHLTFHQAPNPTDVYWENLRFTESDLDKRFWIGLFVTLAFMAVCFSLIYLQVLFQQYLRGLGDSALINQLIDFMVAIIVSILNKAIQLILIQISHYQGHHTQTELNISISQKLSVLMFVNTAIFPFIASFISAPSNQSVYQTIYGDNGVVSQIIYIFIFNSVLPIVLQASNIDGIPKHMQREYETQKHATCVLTQSQLNQLYEEPEFDITLRYAEILRNMFITAAYSPIIPIGAFIILFGIVINYWTDQYNLLRRRTVKYSLSEDLSIEMTEMLEYTLPLFSSANMFFFYFIQYDIRRRQLSIIGATLGLIHCFLPMQYFNEQIFQLQEQVPNNETYSNMEAQFLTDYGRSNPATAQDCQQTFFRKILNANISGNHQIHQQPQKD